MTEQKIAKRTADPLAGHLVLGKLNLTLAYLASPYSPKGTLAAGWTPEGVKDMRFKEAARAAAWLMKEDPKLNVFSPIVNSHVLHVEGHLGGDWAFWEKIDTDYIYLSDVLIVLCIPGWRESTGVTEEIEIAKRFNMEVLYLLKINPVAFGADLISTGGYKLSKRAPK